MAESRGNPTPVVELVYLDNSTQEKGGARRQPPSALARRTGGTTLNANATDILVAWAIALGLDSSIFGVRLGANVEEGTVGIVVDDPGKKGVARVRVSKDGTAITVNFRPVYNKFTTLRPATNVDAVVTTAVDKNGTQVLLVQLKGATEHRKVSRKDSETAQKSDKA